MRLLLSDVTVKPPSNQDKLDQVVMPIIGEMAGERLRLVRMKMLLDQRELGDLLGVSQQQMSKLESGRLEHSGFTLARFKIVLGKYYTFVLFGTQVGAVNWQLVRRRYYDVKLRIRRKPGSGAWKKGNAAGVELQEERREERKKWLKGSDDLSKKSDKNGS